MVPDAFPVHSGKLNQDLLLAEIPCVVACGDTIGPLVGTARDGLPSGFNPDNGQMSTQFRFSAADRAGTQRLLGGLFPVLLVPQHAGPALQILKKDGQQQHAYRRARHRNYAASHGRHPLISSLWVTVFTYSVPPRAYRASEMSMSF